MFWPQQAARNRSQKAGKKERDNASQKERTHTAVGTTRACLLVPTDLHSLQNVLLSRSLASRSQWMTAACPFWNFPTPDRFLSHNWTQDLSLCDQGSQGSPNQEGRFMSSVWSIILSSLDTGQKKIQRKDRLWKGMKRNIETTHIGQTPARRAEL